MIWTGLLTLGYSAKSNLSFSLAIGAALGLYVWLIFTVIILIYLILLALTGTNLIKQLSRLIMPCIGAAVAPFILHAIMSFLLDSLVDSTSYENGGEQYPEIITSIFSLAPSAGVFIGFALGLWLHHILRKSKP